MIPVGEDGVVCFVVFCFHLWLVCCLSWFACSSFGVISSLCSVIMALQFGVISRLCSVIIALQFGVISRLCSVIMALPLVSLVGYVL